VFIDVQNRVDDRPFTETTRELDDGVLQFVDATGSESGQYICTATNSVGTSTVTIELNVRGIQTVIVVVHGLIVQLSNYFSLRSLTVNLYYFLLELVLYVVRNICCRL